MKSIVFPLAVTAAFAALCSVAAAATYTVTNSANAGAGSLREAVNLANTNPGADTIVFDTAGVFSTSQTITLGGGQIQITGALTIEGPTGETRRLTIDADNQSRIFLIELPGSGLVSLRRLDLTRGNTTEDGGVIRNTSPPTSTLELIDCYLFNSNARHGGGIDAGAASLVLTDTSVNYNEATGRGGGLTSSGVVTITRGEIRQNEAAGDGGGWWMDGGSATLTDADIVVNFGSRGAGIHLSNAATLVMTGGGLSSNRATDSGGAMRAVGASSINLRRVRVYDNHGSTGAGLALRLSTLIATNTLIISNEATGEGGGIRFNQGSTGVLKNCTVSGNEGTPGHAGLSVDTASVSLGNTVVAENPTYGDDDMSGSFFSLGHNLIGSLGNATGFSNGIDGDVVGGENGSPRVEADLDSGSRTFAPMARSRCLEAGDPSLVSGPDYGSAPLLDAEGSARVRGVVDIGALEGAFNAIITNTNDSGPGSLRAALALTPTDISFDASFFGTTLRTITLTTGQITLNSDLSIVGPAPGIKVSGNNTSRVFNVTNGAISLKRVRVIEGAASGDGGGIRIINPGTSLTLDDAGVSNSTATGRGGGLYAQDATVSVTNSTFSNNAADADGGGIHVNGATVNITNSTLSTNTSKGGGGGLHAGGTGTTTLLNCTIADNTCDSDAGGAAGNGGGLRRNAGTLTVGNTVIARNSDASPSVIHPDVSGTFVSLGHNLVGKIDGMDAGGTPFQNGLNGDLAGTIASPLSPGLNALQQNPASSPTRIHPLQAGSPARDAGDSGLLTHAAWPSTPVGSDQRGQFREIGTRVDIGAAEYPDANVAKISVESDVLSEFLLQPTRLKFRRSYDDGTDLVVNVTTAGSTAGAGDYLLSGASYSPTGAGTFTITIPAGTTSALLTLTPTDDGLAEGLETVSIGLAAGAGYQLDSGDPAARSLFIYDDEYVVTIPASSGPGSLREAIQQANIGGGGQITIQGDLTIPLGGSQLVISSDIAIVATHAVIDGEGVSRVLWIDDGSPSASLTGVELVRGNGTGGNFTGGGALFVDAYCTVALNSCRLRDSTSSGSGGGLQANSGSTVEVSDCAIVDNSASGGGGGVYGGSASLSLINTTVAGNAAAMDGGGVSAIGGSLSLIGSTLTENSADTSGFGPSQGGGAFALAAGLLLYNTVIASNQDLGTNSPAGVFAPDMGETSATWIGAARNCIGINSGVSSQFPAVPPGPGGSFAGSPISPIDPLLLRIDTPRTTYCEFEYASVLRDAGANAAATAPTDQRGYTRISNGSVDIGAVEMDFLLVTNTNAAGAGSLRQALTSAQAAGHGTIVFAASPFNVPRTIVTGGTEYSTSGNVTLWGPSSASARLTLSGENSRRVLNVTGVGKSVELRNLDIVRGSTSGNAIGNRAGAGLLVSGPSTLSLRRCVVRDCAALAEGGGAAATSGSQLIARDSTFSGNSSGLSGGGLSNNGTIILERVTLSDNTTTANGGGLANFGTASLTNCTFSNNSANGHGGGIDTNAGLLGTVTLTHCTLTQNRANNNNVGTDNAGGIRAVTGTVNVRASLITGNDALGSSQDDITGTFSSLGRNLIGLTTGGTGFSHGTNGDLVGSQASLGPLRNNGGDTHTHALGAASAAVNAAGLPTTTTTDQRRLTRSGQADIGAFELTPESYAYWAAHEFSTLPNTGITSDYDGDGFQNGYEYATGSDATNPLSLPELTLSQSNNQWHVTTAVSPVLITGSLVAQSSANLTSWSTIPPATYSPAGFSPSGKNILVTVTFDFTANRQFVRLTYTP